MVRQRFNAQASISCILSLKWVLDFGSICSFALLFIVDEAWNNCRKCCPFLLPLKSIIVNPKWIFKGALPLVPAGMWNPINSRAMSIIMKDTTTCSHVTWAHSHALHRVHRNNTSPYCQNFLSRNTHLGRRCVMIFRHHKISKNALWVESSIYSLLALGVYRATTLRSCGATRRETLGNLSKLWRS